MHSHPAVFKIKPVAKGTYRLLSGLTAFVFLDAMFVTYLAIHLRNNVLWPVAILVWILCALIIFITRGSRQTFVAVSPREVQITGDIFGKRIAQTDLLKSEMRIVNLGEHPDWKPSWKLIGTNLPGYHSGWFRLKNGKKGLIFVTDFSDVLVIPLQTNSILLLSAENNIALLSALKNS